MRFYHLYDVGDTSAQSHSPAESHLQVLKRKKYIAKIYSSVSNPMQAHANLQKGQKYYIDQILVGNPGSATGNLTLRLSNLV